jgi:plastocyanin domain-containing protein
MKSIIAILSIIGIVSIVGIIFVLSGGRAGTESASVDNVSVVNGQQIIAIKTKGGYWPKKTVAKAGLPTILRFETTGTFDCSSAMRIPSLGISKNLPASGTTDIDIASPAEGLLQGTCIMGMYPFEIDFQN